MSHTHYVDEWEKTYALPTMSTNGDVEVLRRRTQVMRGLNISRRILRLYRSGTVQVETVGSVFSVHFETVVLKNSGELWMKYELCVLQRNDLMTAARRV